MLINIIETGLVKELLIIGKNGCSYEADLIGGAFSYDKNKDGEWLMSQEEYDFWNVYINNLKENACRIEKLSAKIGLSVDEINVMLSGELDADYSEHSDITERFLDELEKEYEDEE